jgi:shikimate dehydrogenase
VREAERRGCRVIDGLDIFVEQTALALASWSGITADRAAMRDAAEEYLAI